MEVEKQGGKYRDDGNEFCVASEGKQIYGKSR